MFLFIVLLHRDGRFMKRGRLVNEFGPQLKAGDTFGILCIATQDNLKVVFELNGESLGVAFDVPRETLGLEILPFVRFLDSTVVSIANYTNSRYLISYKSVIT